MNRDVCCGSRAIIRNSKADYKNKDKLISFLKATDMVHNDVLQLTFASQPTQPSIIIHLTVINE